MRAIIILSSALILAACKPCDHSTGGSAGTGGAPPLCTYTPDAAPGCLAIEHPCTNVGVEDEACGFNPSNGLAGPWYCSTACGSCLYCRARGIQGQPCEVAVAGSCDDGLTCVSDGGAEGTCWPTGPGGCLHCRGGG